MKWLDAARQQEAAGFEEIGGPQANKSVIAYFHQINRPDITSDEETWCVALYFWCLQKARANLAPILPSDRLLAYSATTFGTRISNPASADEKDVIHSHEMDGGRRSPRNRTGPARTP